MLRSFCFGPVVAALLATPVFAQSEPVMQLGIPGDTVMISPSAFTSVEARGDMLVLHAHRGFAPVIADYTANAPQQAISVSICDIDLAPFTVAAPISDGYIEIPTGSAAFAEAAAPVLQGDVGCDAVTFPQGAPTPVPAANPVPPALPGLHLAVAGEEHTAWPPGIARVRLLRSEGTDVLTLEIELGPQATAWMTDATTRNIGSEIQISTCGEILITGPIPYPFTEGILSFPIGSDQTRAVEIADNITSAITCD
ncbi:hypothetical protein [Nioella sp.]|uniref:hypothetical protein n=1 Tax=Nioella sp. TaxID=1912091 RepID=UPI003B530388